MENRTIKFKAKRLDNGEWVEGDLLQHKDGVVEIGVESFSYIKNEVKFYEYSKIYEIDPATVCQFTGLKDDDGNDIFEGDYLTNDGTVIFVVGFVVYQYAASRKGENKFIYSLYALSKSCTVCGNRFDRKEGEI